MGKWNRFDYPDHCLVARSTVIHKTAVIGPDSMSIKVDEKQKKLIQFEHQGGICINEDVRIGPLSVIHRATLEGKETVIKSGTHIGTMVNIGHNSVIGHDCVIVSGTNIGGSVQIGDDVWIGMDVSIKPHVKICSHAVIGIGSVVINDIDKSGVYVGNPARYIRERGEGKPL